MLTSDYCREIEAYLCRKNDGHLIRVVGPSFDLVSRWAADGVPLKVAFCGIDRYFERYYRKGPRRRPVRIDFCEADVLDVFDEWRRAIGLSVGRAESSGSSDSFDGDSIDESAIGASFSSGAPRRGLSLPAHLERVLLRLTDARAKGVLGDEADDFLDRVSRELDHARSSGRNLRGDRRRTFVKRLEALDRELLELARAGLDESQFGAFQREAEEELAGFRTRMPADAYARAREAAVNQLVRDRFGLPTLMFV